MGHLRDAALTAEIERPLCPGCVRPVAPDWLLCPSCRTTLAHLCERCQHAVAADWDACAWCGASFAPPIGVVRPAPTAPAAADGMMVPVAPALGDAMTAVALDDAMMPPPATAGGGIDSRGAALH